MTLAPGLGLPSSGWALRGQRRMTPTSKRAAMSRKLRTFIRSECAIHASILKPQRLRLPRFNPHGSSARWVCPAPYTQICRDSGFATEAPAQGDVKAATQPGSQTGWSGHSDNSGDRGTDEGLAEAMDCVGKDRLAGEQGALTSLRKLRHR